MLDDELLSYEGRYEGSVRSVGETRARTRSAESRRRKKKHLSTPREVAYSSEAHA